MGGGTGLTWGGAGQGRIGVTEGFGNGPRCLTYPELRLGLAARGPNVDLTLYVGRADDNQPHIEDIAGRIAPEHLVAFHAMMLRCKLVAQLRLDADITPDFAPQTPQTPVNPAEGGHTMTTRRPTSADYAEMADDYAAYPPTIDEVTSVEVSPAVLRKGRPAKGAPAVGKTPALPIRLPESIRAEIEHRVQAGESDSAAELIRQAIVEYFDNHPVASH
ncbi:ribbon-helix-helix domain-containing protein [Mycolicibacterium sp. CH28]|uniref:ribbon-helix-helix domain-containing protein n=1 Tax=Mycolicibacterium sp. CH28 TaxID=2512237 RepID=UPI001912955A|nr:ribbon-helix-helix domain-containing protein [Mycolicibacterium sp. CH28]